MIRTAATLGLVMLAIVVTANAQFLVRSEVKVSQSTGGFGGVLANGDAFGLGLAAIGDLNGDGIGDLVVGARGTDGGGFNRGAIWTVFLDSDGTPCSPACWQQIGDGQGGFPANLLNDGDLFGFDIEPLGDLNGDGFPDVAVGAELDDSAGTNAGSFWLVFLDGSGSTATLPPVEITQGLGGFTGVIDPNDRFGRGIANLGDLDGNGTPDLAVGAYLDDDGGINRGAVWILFLGPSGGSYQVISHQKISSTSGSFIGPLDDGDSFGVSIAALGDLNGDGMIEIAVAATNDDDGALNSGSVWILSLDATGNVQAEQKISQTNGVGFTGPVGVGDGFGHNLELIPDRDCDGVPELIVTDQSDDGGMNTGAIWVLLLDPTGTVHGQRKISATQGGLTGPLDVLDEFGSGLAFLGDRDGDGHPELGVGAHLDDDGGTDRGAYYVLEIGRIGPCPGTGEDLDLATGVNAPATICPPVKTAAAGNVVNLLVSSPGGAFASTIPLVVAQAFPTGSQLPPSGFQGLWVTASLLAPSPPVILFDGFNGTFFNPLLLPPQGLALSGVVPVGFAGQSLVIQGLAFPLVGVSPTIPRNGILAATDGHVLQF